jgi:hypothetical protein
MQLTSTSATTTYHRMTVDGVGVFNVYKEGLGAKWAGIAQYWADPKARPEVFDAFVSLPATEQRHTLGTSHPERITPTLGRTNTFTSPNRANARSRLICNTTTGRTSLRIRRGKRGCASTSPRLYWSGGGTIPHSSLLVAKRSSEICRMPKSICSTPAISPWTKKTMKSRVSFLSS